MAATAVLDQLRLGDHVCWSFTGDAERLDAEARFVEAGVRDGHKILVFARSPDAERGALTERGVATEGLLASGQLEIWSDGQAYLSGGRFDPEGVLGALASLVEAAVRQGYPGVRCISDMSWVPSVVGGAPRLRWYEAQLNRLLVEGAALAVCQYDTRLSSDSSALRYPRSVSSDIDANSSDGGPTSRSTRRCAGPRRSTCYRPTHRKPAACSAGSRRCRSRSWCTAWSTPTWRCCGELRRPVPQSRNGKPMERV